MTKFLWPVGCLVLLLLPLLSSAQGYTALINIPGINNPQDNFSDFINALYALSISIAGLLAVVKLIIAGMKYMLSDVVTRKEEAIKDIYGAVFGLLIVLSAFLILYVINPNLTTTDVFRDIRNNPAKAMPAGSVVTGTGAGSVATAPTATPAPGKAVLPLTTKTRCVMNREAGCIQFNDACKNGTPPGVPENKITGNIVPTWDAYCRHGAEKVFSCTQNACDRNSDPSCSSSVDYNCDAAKSECVNYEGTSHLNSNGKSIICIYPWSDS